MWRSCIILNNIIRQVSIEWHRRCWSRSLRIMSHFITNHFFQLQCLQNIHSSYISFKISPMPHQLMFRCKMSGGTIKVVTLLQIKSHGKEVETFSTRKEKGKCTQVPKVVKILLCNHIANIFPAVRDYRWATCVLQTLCEKSAHTHVLGS